MTSLPDVGERLFRQVLAIRNGSETADPGRVTLETTVSVLVDDLKELMEALRGLAEDSKSHLTSRHGISSSDISDLMKADASPASSAATSAAATSTVSSLLSVNHFRAIYSSIEVLCRAVLIPGILVSFPFYSELLEAEGKPARMSAAPTYPKSLILDYNTVTRLGQLPASDGCSTSVSSLVWRTFMGVVDVLTSPAFSGMMAGRNLKRVIAFGLHMMRCMPSSEMGIASSEVVKVRLTARMDEESKRSYVSAVKDLIHMCKSSESNTVSSAWFLQQCGAMLTSMIVEHQGLKAVLQSFLDNTFADRDASKLQDQVCRTVTSVPSGVDKNTYFGVLLPQVASLLWTAQEQNDLLLLRVCVTLCNRVASLCPAQLVRHVVMRLLFPLLSIGASPAQYDILKSYYPEGKNKFDTGVLADEVSMKRCVEVCYHLIKIVPPSLQLLQVLHRSGLMLCVFSLHSFLVSEGFVSWLRRPCAEICKFLVDQDILVSSVADDLQTLMLIRPVNIFHLGSMGGVEVLLGDRGNKLQDILSEGVEENELLSILRGPSKFVKASDSLGGESELANESLNHLSSLYHQLKNINGADTSSKRSSGELIPKAIAVAKSIGCLFEDSDAKLDQGGGRTDATKQTGSAVASALFMRALESFAGTPNSTSSTPVSAAMGKSQSGIVLLALQSHVPIHVMLANGVSIIRLMKSILKSYADQLAEASQYIEKDLLRRDQIFADASCENNTLGISPLIQEVTTATTVEAITPSHPVVDAAHPDIGDKDDLEAIDMCLSLLGAMLAFGNASRSPEEEAALRDLLEPLQTIAGLGGSSSLAEAASDVAIAIMTRGVPESALMKAALSSMAPPRSPSAGVAPAAILVESQSRSNFRQACERAMQESFQSEHPALRALGVKELLNATKVLNQAGEIREADYIEVLDMVLNLLEDPDSFVYLSAIHAIRSLIEMNRKVMFTRILVLYRASDAWTEKHFRIRIRDGSSGDVITTRNITRRRAFLGEALSFGVRKLGDIMGAYGPEVISTCISVAKRARHEGASQVASDSRAVSTWNINNMHISETSDGSSKIDVELAASVADRALLRQSAVSLIADTVATAGFGSLSNLDEVVQFASDILEVEYSNEKLSVAMRRSAIFLIRYVITGLDRKIFSARDPGDLLHRAYARVKIAMRDSDTIVKFHAECAFAAIDGLMRRQLFLNEEGSVAAENRSRGPLIRIL